MKSKNKKSKEITLSVDGFAKSLDPPKNRLTVYKWIRNIKAGKKSTKRNGKKIGFPDGVSFVEYLPGKYVIKVKN